MSKIYPLMVQTILVLVLYCFAVIEYRVTLLCSEYRDMLFMVAMTIDNNDYVSLLEGFYYMSKTRN
jgi:hypothetical protein